MSDHAFSIAAQTQSRNNLKLGVSIGLLGLSLALASWYDTWLESLIIGIPAVAVPALLTRLAPLSVATRLSYGLGFMVFAALLIHQAHGMIEMHFAIFALLAFLLYYRDIWPILAAAGLIAVHHFAFNYLQVAGAPVYVFEYRTGLDIVMTHAAFVVAETIVLLMIARQFDSEARQSEALHIAMEKIAADANNIDLNVRVAGEGSVLTEQFNDFMDAIAAAINNARLAASQLTGHAADLQRMADENANGAQMQQSSSSRASSDVVNGARTAAQSLAEHLDSAAEASQPDLTYPTYFSASSSSTGCTIFFSSFCWLTSASSANQRRIARW